MCNRSYTHRKMRNFDLLPHKIHRYLHRNANREARTFAIRQKCHFYVNNYIEFCVVTLGYHKIMEISTENKNDGFGLIKIIKQKERSDATLIFKKSFLMQKNLTIRLTICIISLA